MRRLIPCLLVASACASTPTPPPQPTPAPEERLTLRFRWPDGLEATVKNESHRIRDARPPAHLSSTSTMRVELRGSEVWLHTENAQSTGDELAVMLSGLPMPIQVVSTSGQFLRLEETQRTVEGLMARLPGMRQPSKRAAMEKLLVSSLEQGVRDDWNVLVGVWAGQELTLGQSVRTQSEGQVAALGDATIRLNVTLTAHERVSCRSGESELRCVRLSFESVPDPADLRSALPKLLRSVLTHAGAESADKVEVKDAEIVNRAELIAEPDTLVPHRLEVRKHTRLVLAADGKELPMEARDESRFVYLYAR